MLVAASTISASVGVGILKGIVCSALGGISEKTAALSVSSSSGSESQDL